MILVQKDMYWDDATGKWVNPKEIRAIVRKVALRQFGHWLMGNAVVKGHSVTISGSYGNDGLPRTVPDEVFEEAIPLPANLRELWNKGGGWNGAGSEAGEMRRWAVENLAELYKPGKKKNRNRLLTIR